MCLILFALPLPYESLYAQCSFIDAQKKAEYDLVVAFFNQNPDNTLSPEWAALANNANTGVNTNCDICQLPEILCNNAQGYADFWELNDKRLSVIPEEIAVLNTHRTDIFLEDNVIECYPAGLIPLCQNDGIVGIGGLPVSDSLSFVAWCTNPVPFCVSNTTPDPSCTCPSEINVLGLSALNLGCNPVDTNSDGIPDTLATALISASSPNSTCSLKPIEWVDAERPNEDCGGRQIERVYKLENECGDFLMEFVQVISWREEGSTIFFTCPATINLGNNPSSLPDERRARTDILAAIANQNDSCLMDMQLERIMQNCTTNSQEWRVRLMEQCGDSIICTLRYTWSGVALLCDSMQLDTMSTIDTMPIIDTMMVVDTIPPTIELDSTNCDLINIRSDSTGSIILQNLTAPIVLVQILNEKNGQLVYDCVGNCQSTEQTIVADGNYIVSVRFFDKAWKLFCSTKKRIAVQRVSIDLENGVGESMPTTICGEIEIAYGNNQLQIKGRSGQFYHYKVERLQPDWQSILNCAAQLCENEQTLSGLPNGTYKIRTWDENWKVICEGIEIMIGADAPVVEEENIPPEVDSLSNSTTCGEVTIQYDDNEILIQGVPGEAYYYKIQKWFGDFSYVVNCIAECSPTFRATDLSPGVYGLQIFNSNWTPLCNSLVIQLGNDLKDELSTKYRQRSSDELLQTFNQAKISLYPNPVHNQLMIDASSYVGKKGTIELVNQLGQVVKHLSDYEIPIEAIPLNVSDLKHGLYFLQVSIEKEPIMSQRIVIAQVNTH